MVRRLAAGRRHGGCLHGRGGGVRSERQPRDHDCRRSGPVMVAPNSTRRPIASNGACLVAAEVGRGARSRAEATWRCETAFPVHASKVGTMSPRLRIATALSGLFLFLSSPGPAVGQTAGEFGVVSLASTEASIDDAVVDRLANLSVRTVPLYDALRMLAEVSGVTLALSPSDVAREDRTVTCRCDAVTVGEALDELLRLTPLAYAVVNGQIVVYSTQMRTPTPELAAVPGVRLVSMSSAQDKSLPEPAPLAVGTVTGRVVDASTQQPLTGAQVYITENSQGTLTNADGRFVLTNVPDGPNTVRVQMIGFQTVEQTVTVQPGGSVSANFELTTLALALDEIVVTGTAGQARRREVGNSVSAVNSADLALQPIMSAQDAITSQVPGMVLMGNEGVAGAGPTIRIRGVTSMTQGNAPLIYVDGVRIRSEDFPGTAQGQSASPLNSINPNDIERIEVIKGAAATTLYGTEASSGVIQIITKRGAGVAGDPIWNVTVTQGLSRSPQIGPDLDDNWYETWGEDTGDLFMEPYLRTGRTQDYNLSVRGAAGEGAARVDYFLSGGWGDQQGVIPENASESLNVRGNLGFAPMENLRVLFNSAYSNRDIMWIPGGNLAKGFTLNVMRGPFDYTADADTVFFTEFDTVEDIRQFTSGIELNFTPTDALTASLNIGIDNVDTEYIRTESFGSLLEPQGFRSARRFSNINRTIDFQTTYNRSIAGVSTTSSAGFQAFSSSTATVTGESSNFAGPGNPTLDTGSQQESSEDRLDEVNAGFFFQELLGFGDRFFLTLGARMDGNSAFGEDYGLQLYPKVSASYVISDEGFWPEFLETTKLRAAYGESGKAPGYFASHRTWSPTSALEGQPAVSPSTRGNPLLGPERSRELEAGVELTALQGRLSLDGSVYTQRTVDALLEVPQDPTLGFTGAQIDNVGTIENQGYEVNLTGVLVSTDRLSWEVGLGAAGNRSEMVDMGGTADVFLGGSLSPGMWVRKGYPVPSYFGPVIQNPDEVGAAPVTEEEFLGPIYPTHSFILSSTLHFGRLSASAQGEYQGGHVNLSHTAWRNAQRGVWPPCLAISQRIQAGETSQLTAGEIFTCGSDFMADWGAYVSPADNFRLTSVSLNYRMPESWTPGFGQWSATLGARNLFLLTDYIGLDPGLTQGGEGLSRHEYYQLPVPRSLSLTLRATF
ncbi:MAG: TonB-dependent receptor plug domain-containing protein [Gemmatimonas sp.]|nr:TonB-dependent receptor plug domain-containing protein [Gemmatimonas sp.]